MTSGSRSGASASWDLIGWEDAGGGAGRPGSPPGNPEDGESAPTGRMPLIQHRTRREVVPRAAAVDPHSAFFLNWALTCEATLFSCVIMTGNPFFPASWAF